ncbi:MAG: hypothetical protein ACTSPB_00735 [Candidatus Thorarchaeota archaeon]
MKGKILSASAILIAFALLLAPLVSASSETGTGQSRELDLVFDATDGYVNATVGIPEYMRNDTNQSFEVSFVSDSWSYQNVTLNVTINGTAYTTGIIMVANNGTATGYINITEDDLDLGTAFNLTVELDEDGTTEDVYWGTIDLVDASEFSTRNMSEIMMSVMTAFIVIGVIIMAMKMFANTMKPKKRM